MGRTERHLPCRCARHAGPCHHNDCARSSHREHGRPRECGRRTLAGAQYARSFHYAIWFIAHPCGTGWASTAQLGVRPRTRQCNRGRRGDVSGARYHQVRHSGGFRRLACQSARLWLHQFHRPVLRRRFGLCKSRCLRVLGRRAFDGAGRKAAGRRLFRRRSARALDCRVDAARAAARRGRRPTHIAQPSKAFGLRGAGTGNAARPDAQTCF